MRSFRIITPLVKNKSARTLSIVAGLLLVLMTLAYAYTQVVSKYPTGFVIATASMGTAGMTLEKGSVFGFNSAKSGADTEAYATIQEGACASPATLIDFAEGKEGFVTTTNGTITFSTTGADGRAGPDGAAQTSYVNSTLARTFSWDKKFLWDCGNPTVTSFSMWYRVPTWTAPNTTALANMFQVWIVKPNGQTVNLNVGGAANVQLPQSAITVPWTQLTGTIPAWTFDQPGLYTLRINGAMRGATGANLKLRFDDVNLTVTSGFESYAQDVQFIERATPYSAGGAYVLEVKARKTSGDTSESTFIQVCGDNLTPCASWNTRYTVPSTQSTWNVYNGYTLTTAEYNGGLVRIRYIDGNTPPIDDFSRGGVDVEYQRINVDQGVCVDLTRNIESDCGKCHNYGGDVTKPWPSTGMHNQHAQSESISDCLWCHPNAGTNAGHSDGVVKITGTKLYRASDGNLNGAPGTALYDANKQCSQVACHMNQLTPRWDATFVTSGFNGTSLIARNCSRCHNTGSAGLDSSSNLNLNVGWPNTGDGGGHISHNAAVAFDEYSCQSNGSCHPDNRGQHSVVGDSIVDVKMAPNYGSPNSVIKYIKTSATKGDGYCVNVTCHGGQATPKFNLSSTNPINLASTNGSSCVMCHVGEDANGWGTGAGNAKQYNSPISGLHRGSPGTSGQDHAAGLTNGCQACHFAASLTKHFQFGGSTNMDNPLMDSMQGASFVTANGYTTGSGTAPNYTTPPTCAVTTSGCHAESTTTNRNPVTTWKRLWSWDSYDEVTPIKQCNGCHGHWGTFTSGVSQPHFLSNTDTTLRTKLITNHTESGNDCGTMCHAQGATTPTIYNHGVAIGMASKDMSLNNKGGFQDTGNKVGCNVCHLNEGEAAVVGLSGNHVFADATWVTTTMLDGPVVTCYRCHGGGTANSGSGYNYWPDGSAYPDIDGGTAAIKRHTYHITKIAAKLSPPINLATVTDLEQKKLCAFCHPYTSYPGEPGHVDGALPADVTRSAFNPMWSSYTGNYPTTADGGTLPTWTTATQQCVGIDCHNNQATTGTFAWNSNGTSTCLMCHTVGGAGNNPTTGLHNITVAVQHHDDGLSGGCGACHGTAPATHINGTFTADSGTNTVAERFVSRTGMTYTELTPTLGRSGTCSGTGGLAACHSDGGNWARLWSTEANSVATATSDRRCNVCHGQWSTIANSSGWMAGTSHYKAGGANVATNGQGSGHDTTTCDSCHVYGASGNARHNVVTRQININNAAGPPSVVPARTNNTYGSGTAGCTGSGSCHVATSPYNFPISIFPALYVTGSTFPAPSCVGCHQNGNNTTTPKVSATSGHVSKTIGGAFGACEDCHAGHADATAAGPNVVYVPTTYGASILVPSMNMQYSTGTHGSRFRLGGTATASTTYTNVINATTEAGMCWGCHDKIGVSEWGTHTNATTGNSTYDYGDLYTTSSTIPGTKTSNWTNASWRSGKGRGTATSTSPYWYKRGAIQSTHSVNFDSGSVALTTSGNSLGFGRKESPDAVANIRCSYCHDVHGNHDGVKGDTSGGAGTLDAPYLRGSWKGNPYKEDGAPVLGQASWTANGQFGIVPRASAVTTNSGSSGSAGSSGWWIDQNSNHPNSKTNVHATSGLCEQCHGTNKTGIWNTASIGTIDWSTNGIGEANNWTSGYNGHANSVINGPGRGTAASAESYARNIFTRTKRGSTGMSEDSNTHTGTDMGVATSSATRGYTYRGASAGYAWLPQTAASNQTAFRAFAWGTPVAGASGRSAGSIWATGTQALTQDGTLGTETANFDAQDKYHNFTCSKCHNPHASRLPKLMITNCLDTNHNTWEDNTGFTGTTLVGAPFAGTRHSQWASAQNCHRLDANAAKTSGQAQLMGRGWNRVTPWLEFTSPNSTRTTITPDVPVP